MRASISKAWLTGAAAGLAATPLAAAELKVKVEVPKLAVAEYHRPYLAVWIERPDQSFVTNLAVWYDLRLRDNEGAKWLKDMRQWWRRSGRSLDMPVDGISGATRAPGDHHLAFADGRAPLGTLPPGRYELVVEAAREVGGRELLRVPFEWPPRAALTAATRGEHELGALVVDLAP